MGELSAFCLVQAAVLIPVQVLVAVAPVRVRVS
jgi:hypothetical protein